MTAVLSDAKKPEMSAHLDGSKLDPSMSLGQGTVQKVKEGKTTDELDDAILRVNGHEAVLERRFSWISALGLAFSITNSWVGYLVGLIPPF